MAKPKLKVPSNNFHQRSTNIVFLDLYRVLRNYTGCCDHSGEWKINRACAQPVCAVRVESQHFRVVILWCLMSCHCKSGTTSGFSVDNAYTHNPSLASAFLVYPHQQPVPNGMHMQGADSHARAIVLMAGLEPAISSLGRRRLIHETARAVDDKSFQADPPKLTSCRTIETASRTAVSSNVLCSGVNSAAVALAWNAGSVMTMNCNNVCGSNVSPLYQRRSSPTM
eukprot:6473111-Amphidinium_carterae.1